MAASIGSTLTNRTLAGTLASTSNLGAYFWLSTDVPAQTCSGQGCVLAQATISPGRLVRIM